MRDGHLVIRKVARKLGIRRPAYAEQIRQMEDTTLSMQKALSEQLQEFVDETRVRWREEDEIIRFLARRAKAEIESEKIARARLDETRAALQRLRSSSNYEEAWVEEDPLVSVRIASYRDTEALIDRAVASVLRQTHQNFEIIIVNDGPNEKSRNAIAKIGDPRIRYEEFASRSLYPDDPHLRWMVAGAPGGNYASSKARGSWIAPLDDDDEFSDDHIEKLLEVARKTRAEFAYGAIDQHRLVTGDRARIFSFPPAISQISMQAAIYHAGLRFMGYDEESWRVDEPGDWNLIRRMCEAGVRMAATEDYVTSVYMLPYDAKDE